VAALDCSEATLGAAVFSASDNEWRTIDVPDEVRTGTEQPPFNVRGIGWTGREALFSVTQDATKPGYGLWFYNPGSDEWRAAPEPDRGAEAICFQGDSLLAARVGNLDPETNVTGSALGLASPTIKTWQLDTTGAPAWVELPDTPKPPIDADQTWVSCLGGTRLIYTAHGAKTQRVEAAMSFDAATREWVSIPPLDALVGDVSGATVGGTIVAWPGAALKEYFMLDPGATSWRTVSRSDEHVGQARVAGSVGNYAFVAFSTTGEVNQILLVDPSAEAAR
jgi:hypothetical protein